MGTMDEDETFKRLKRAPFRDAVRAFWEENSDPSEPMNHNAIERLGWTYKELVARAIDDEASKK